MATAYYSSDIDFVNLQNLTLRELREPEATGSEAVPVELVKDMINTVYAEAFNDQRMKQSAREKDISFNLANDTTLVSDVLAGAVTLPLSDSTTFRTAGKVLLESEIADYTGNTIITNTLTGVTNIDINHLSGEVVRQMYPLSSIASDIEAEQIQYLDVNGIPQQYISYENLITATRFYPNSYAVYKGHIIFSRQSTTGGTTVLPKVLMIYTQKVTPLSMTTDKPSLIPNSWRIPILVYGAAMKIAASDAFRTSWDWWDKEYNKALSQYIAFKNNRVKDINNKRRPVAMSPFTLYR